MQIAEKGVRVSHDHVHEPQGDSIDSFTLILYSVKVSAA
jgi:hypothetical protein